MSEETEEVAETSITDLYHLEGKPRTDLKDGLYVNMPESVYFALDRIGSSDLKVLASDMPEDFFYGSKKNPDREVVESEDDLLFGRALHSFVLEGQFAFESTYVKSPHDSYVPAAAKAWKKEVIASGKVPLKAKTYRSVYHMGYLVRNHPTIGEYLKGGIAEITILFTFDGIPMRARFDKLLSNEIIDLKSLGRHKGAVWAPDGIDKQIYTCLRVVRDLGYSLQRHLYSRARGFMRSHVENGLVYGASPAQMTWLKEISKQETWGFMWLFYRKLSNSSKSPAAPVLTPIYRQMADYTDIKGEKMLNIAVENYHRLVEQFGWDVPWARLSLAVEPDDAVFAQLFGPDTDDASSADGFDDEDQEDYGVSVA